MRNIVHIKLVQIRWQPEVRGGSPRYRELGATELEMAAAQYSLSIKAIYLAQWMLAGAASFELVTVHDWVMW